MSRMAIAVLAIAAILLSGCFEREESFTLNPNGSGKVHVMQKGRVADLIMTDIKDTGQLERQLVRFFAENSKGIDVWSELQVEVDDDGNYQMEGTAYFRSLGQVSIGSTRSEFEKRLAIRKTGENEARLAYQIPSPANVKVSDEAMAAFKDGHLRLVQRLDDSLDGLRLKRSYTLPGTIDYASGYDWKKGESTVSAEFTGGKLIRAMRTVLEDDKSLRICVAAGDNKELMFARLSQIAIFGTDLAVGMEGPFKPLFDYRAEIVEARAKWSAICRKNGIAKPYKAPKPQKGRTIVSRSVSLTHMNLDEQKTLALGFDVALPGEIADVRQTQVSALQDGQGRSLLPSNKPVRGNFAQLENDKRTVALTLRLPRQDEPSLPLRGVSGALLVWVGRDIREIDMGVLDMKEMVVGHDLGMTIEKIDKTGDKPVVRVGFKCPRSYIVKIRLFDADASQLEARQVNSSWDGESSVFGYQLDSLPEKAQIVVTLHKEIWEHTVKFKGTNLTLEKAE